MGRALSIFGGSTPISNHMTEYSSDSFFGSDSAALQRFEQMIGNNDSYFFDVEELEAISEHYFGNGQHEKARKAIDYGLQLYPDCNALLLKKAQALLIGSKPRKAMRILDFLEASEPGNTELLLFKAVVHRNLSDHEGTKACLMKALNSTTENQEEIFLDLAFEQEMVNDYKGAIKSLKQSLRINPEYEPCLFELAYCYEMADEIEEGIEFFKQFLDHQPYSYVAWYNLAICYDRLGLWELAINAVEYSLAIQEDFTNAHILRGNLFGNCDKDALAIEAYRESLIYDEQNPMVYSAIGECYERLGASAQAEINYLRALSIDNDYADALMGMGAVREGEGKLSEALEYYQKALESDDGNIDIAHIYCETLVKMGMLTEARTRYLEMTERFVDDEESWIALAALEHELQGASVAVHILQLAMEHIPQSTDLVWHLIKYLCLDGKKVQAEELLSSSLQFQPKKAEYLKEIFPEVIEFSNLAAWLQGLQSEGEHEL